MKGKQKLNAQKNDTQTSPKYPWFDGDRNIVSRVKQYLEAYDGANSDVDVEGMGMELREKYRDYRRKKRNPFLISVRKAYEYITGTPEKTKNEDIDIKSDADDSPEFSSDNENYVEIKNTNMINSSLLKLYNKNQQTNTKKEEKPEPEVETEIEKTNKSRKRKRSKETPNEVPKRAKKAYAFSMEESTVTFSDIAGCEDTLQEVYELLCHMEYPQIFKTLGVKSPSGILLHGPPGCGKTMIANAIAGDLGLPLIRIASTEIVSGVSGESEEKIRDLFTQAYSNAPCILFIDEIDAIASKRETAQREMERRIVTQLLVCMNDLSAKNCQVLVIGATNRPEALDPALRRQGRFDREVKVSIPNEAARGRILRVLCRDYRLHPNLDMNVLARKTPGFVGADLTALTAESAMMAIKRICQSLVDNLPADEVQNSLEPIKLRNALRLLSTNEEKLNSFYMEMCDFENALKLVQPSAQREGFATIPDVTWDDIGALKDIREQLKLTITAPINHPELLALYGLEKRSSGILLFGPPGCGKTMLAKAVANESGLNFISIKGSELLNMYVGETERGVRQCFERARFAAPCVIFFDEVEAICQKRSGVSESSYHVLTQLLTEMDGFDSRENVFVLAATNRPDLMDPACFRPGRFETTLYVGLPSPEERLDILNKRTKNGTCPSLSEDVDLKALALDPRCDGFTGADVSKLVNVASRCCMKEVLDDPAHIPKSVSQCHFEMAFNQMEASVTEEEHKMYQRLRNWRSGTDRPKSKITSKKVLET